MISFCNFHLSDGIRCMPMYVYGSFCVRIGKLFLLYVIICDWMYALKVFGLNLDLLGHPVMTHLDKLRFMCDHSANFWSFCYLGLDVLYVLCDYC